jgi:hypothetical protein
MLLLIRNGVATDFDSLCREFGVDPRDYTAAYVRAKLAQLESDGLVTRTSDDHFEVADLWPRLQSALDISLRGAAALTPGTIVARPFFGVPVAPAEPHDVFVVMPFREDLRPVWEDHIRNAVTTVGLTVARADDFFTADSVIADVWNAIFSASAIIADCTGRNPNVFYEIGVAHVLGRPVVLITQSSDDVPFDLRHIRFIEYEYTPRGMELFEQRLAETLRTATKA